MQTINVGVNPNDGNGDNLRNAFIKVNSNFNELVAIDSSFSGDIQTLNTIISNGSTLNHTHTINQIIGLQTALSGKVSTSTFNTQILAINSSIQAINSTLSDIIDILNTKIGDAPFSGVTYGRRDGEWVEVTGGGPTGDFVPYTGGTKDVVLSANSITANGGLTSAQGLYHFYDSNNQFFVERNDYDYNRLYFNTIDTSGDDFGTVNIIANPEESISLSKAKTSSSEIGSFFLSQNLIELAVQNPNRNQRLNIQDGGLSFYIQENSPSQISEIYFNSDSTIFTREVQLPKVLFNSTTATSVEQALTWNDVQGTMNIGLKGGQTAVKSGVDLVVRVVNKVSPNTTLTKAAYQAVRISGAQAQRLAVELAQANNDNNSADTIGLVCETIATNQEGYIMTVGQLENVNTTGSLQGESWSDGDVLYLSPTTAGRLTNRKPSAPGHIVVMGYVEYAHQNNGKIYVKIMNGWELDELHNVNISAATSGQVLQYNGASSIWENKTIVEDVIVNGVTSRAPSQNAVFDAFDLTRRLIVSNTGSTVTGTVAETIISSMLVPANTLDAVCDLFITFDYNKSTANAIPIRLYYNTTNSLAGATQISLYNTGSFRNGGFNRKFVVKGTSMDLITTVPTTSQLNNQFVDAIFVPSTVITIAPTGNMFFIFTVANDTVGTTFTNKRATVEKMKLS
jgi:hypothetical protein